MTEYAFQRGDLAAKRGVSWLLPGKTFAGDGGVNAAYANVKSGASVMVNGTGLLPENVDGQIICLPFGKSDITTGLEETVVYPIGGKSGLGEDITMARPGSIIGIGFHSNTTIVAGSISVYACVNGATKLLATLNTTDQSTAVTQDKDTDTFTAKQRIGMAVSSSADLDPATADIWGTVLVEV